MKLSSEHTCWNEGGGEAVCPKLSSLFCAEEQRGAARSLQRCRGEQLLLAAGCSSDVLRMRTKEGGVGRT